MACGAKLKFWTQLPMKRFLSWKIILLQYKVRYCCWKLIPINSNSVNKTFFKLVLFIINLFGIHTYLKTMLFLSNSYFFSPIHRNECQISYSQCGQRFHKVDWKNFIQDLHALKKILYHLLEFSKPEKREPEWPELKKYWFEKNFKTRNYHLLEKSKFDQNSIKLFFR
jgi:hypothetical protein